MNTLPRFAPEDLIAEDETELETEGYDFTDEEVAEFERYGDEVEADHIAGHLRSAEEFFAQLESKRRVAS